MTKGTNQPDTIGISGIRRFYDCDALHRIESLRNRETFMEICRIHTREISHTAFLKWLFSNTEFARLSLSPVINLLRLYTSKAIEHKIKDIDRCIINEFLSGEVRKVNNVSGEVELSTDNKRRIDLELIFEYADSKKLRICIENKLYSSEHTNQCAEYYEYYQNKTDDIPTIFIFLSPSKDNTTAEEHFVNLTYQDIYDSILLPLQKHYAAHHSNRSMRYVTDYIETLTSIKYNYHPMVMSREYKELLKQIYNNHRELFLEVFNEFGTEEEKKLAQVSTGSNIKYTVTLQNGESKVVTGFTPMVRLVIETLLHNDNVTPQDLVDRLRRVSVKNFDSAVICFEGDKGADSRYSKASIETPDGDIFVSNQWCKDKADKFIQLVKKEKFPIDITETTI